jgi:hypothetical protein
MTVFKPVGSSSFPNEQRTRPVASVLTRRKSLPLCDDDGPSG